MSRRYSGALFFGVLCGSYMALAGVASAANDQDSSDSLYGKSVFERPRKDYDSDGVSLGSFKFKPSLELTESHNNNIYATTDNAKNDVITKVAPLINLESDWNSNALSFNASGNLGYYSDNSRENYNDYSIGTAGRLDIFRETFLSGYASTSYLHEDRGSPDVRVNSKEPTEYQQNNAGLSFVRDLRRVSLKLDGDFTELNYKNGETSSGAAIINNDRDRDEYKVGARVGYEIIPEYEAFIRTILNDREYDRALDSTGVNRDSSGYEIVAGTALNLGGKTKGEIFAGYMNQSYDSSSLKDVDAAQFGGNILWNATALTSLKAGIVRGVQETVLAGYSGYVATNYTLGLEHELRDNLIGGVNAAYSVDDYEGSAAFSRKDNIAGAGAEVRYLLNRNASIVGKYDYTNRDSNVANQDYDQSVVSLGVKLAM